MKTSRRPLLDTILNPSGLAATVRNNEVRVQKIERAPVKFNFNKPNPPKKAPQPEPAPPTASPIAVISFAGFTGTGGLLSDADFYNQAMGDHFGPTSDTTNTTLEDETYVEIGIAATANAGEDTALFDWDRSPWFFNSGAVQAGDVKIGFPGNLASGSFTGAFTMLPGELLLIGLVSIGDAAVSGGGVLKQTFDVGPYGTLKVYLVTGPGTYTLTVSGDVQINIPMVISGVRGLMVTVTPDVADEALDYQFAIDTWNHSYESVGQTSPEISPTQGKGIGMLFGPGV